MIGTSQLINAFGAPVCFTDTTDIFKDRSGVALYGLDYDASDAGGASGKFGEAAIFNGTTSNISIPTLGGSFYDSDFSISLWVNLNSLGGTSTGYLFSGAGSRDIFINFNTGDSGGGISARLYDGAIRDVVYSSAVAGQWYHVVFVRSKTNGLNLYVDGVSRDTNSYTGNAQALSFTSDGIGGRVQDRNTTNGKIDQVRIFNTALTQSQVTQLYQENNSTVGTHLFGCIANYNLDGSAKESMGTTAYDGVETDITYRYDGTPTAVDFGVGGKSLYGARFNGSSSKITLPSIPELPSNSNNTNDFTFSCWVRSTTTRLNNGGGSNPIFQNYVGSYQFIGFGGNDNANFPTGRLFYYTYGGSGYHNSWIITSNSYADGQWHHVVFTDKYNSGTDNRTRTIYVDGIQRDQDTVDKHFSNQTETNHLIGDSTGSGNRHLDADLDQIRIFNKAISAAEVSKLYGNGAGEIACTYTSTTDIVNYPTGTTPVAYIPFDNSSEDLVSGDFGTLGSGTEFRFGRFGQAMVGNQNTWSADFPNISETANSPFSVSCWVNIADRNSTIYFFLWSSGFGSSSAWGGLLSGQSGKYYTNFGNQVLVSSSSVVPPLNQWFHYVLTYDGTNVKVYSDTEKVIDGNINTSALASNNLKVLYNGSSSEAKIDQMRIYDAALTSSQITELYNEKPEVDTSNFKTVLYTGNGGTQYISNVGMDLETNGGLIWFKNRDQTDTHRLHDSIRGITKYVSTSSTGAQVTISSGGPQSFDSNGFTTSSGHAYNATNEDYVAWVWKGGGDAVSNTDGTITSQVSANTAAGFSIVKWTNDSDASDTIGHGLNSAPQLYIIKRLQATSNWFAYTTAIDGTLDYLNLNTTAAKTDSAQTLPTSDVFTSDHTNNEDMIAYCFHSVSGYSSIGSYSGTGSSGNAITGLGFQPNWLMVKRTDVSGASWIIFDHRRVESDGDQSALAADTTTAEFDYNVDFTSDGFTLNTTTTNANASGTNNYIYIAFK